MNHREDRHWRHPRTTRQAFGSFTPMRDDVSFNPSHTPHPSVWVPVLVVVALIILIAAVGVICGSR